jgi:hypothetical protein
LFQLTPQRGELEISLMLQQMYLLQEGSPPLKPGGVLRQSSSAARDGRDLQIPARPEREALPEGRASEAGATTCRVLGGEVVQYDRPQRTMGWGEARQELVPETRVAVPFIVKDVLAIVTEWALAALRAEGLWEDFMVGVVVLEVEASQEVAADDSHSDGKAIYFAKVDKWISNPTYPTQ